MSDQVEQVVKILLEQDWKSDEETGEYGYGGEVFWQHSSLTEYEIRPVAERIVSTLNAAALSVIERLTGAIEAAAKEIEDFGVCDCCNGCGCDGDGWNEPACVCDCKGECWWSVADSLRSALNPPDDKAVASFEHGEMPSFGESDPFEHVDTPPLEQEKT